MQDVPLVDDAWKPLRDYLACISASVSLWRNFLSNKSIDWMSVSDINQWLGRFENSLEALRELLMYDEQSSLDVQPERSGLPQHYHLNEIVHLWQQIDPDEDYLMIIARLKRAELDHIFESKTASIALLREITQTGLRMRLLKQEPMQLFRWCGLVPLRSPHGGRAYQCAWECYTTQPLPVRYVMIFDVSDEWHPNEENESELQSLLRHETDGLPKLGDLGRDIDRAHAHIHPKWIGRIVLGPLFVSHLTRDENKLQQALDALAEPGQYLAASRIIYEYVLSESENPMTELTDPEGRPHRRLQEFGVRLHGEYYERQVTHLEKHLFAPHGVIQLLDEEYRKEIGHQLNGV